MTDESSLYDPDEVWELRDLPPDLAVLACKHVLEAGEHLGFVDCRGGHLTVLCEETAHEEDNSPDLYGMVHLAHLPSSFEDLSQVRLLGRYSNARLSEDGTWTM